jgi:hypothetical protein
MELPEKLENRCFLQLGKHTKGRGGETKWDAGCRWEMGADGQMGRLLLAMLVLWVAEESQKLFACPLAGPRKSPAYLTSEIRRGVGRRSRVGYSGHRCCIKTEAMPAAVPSRTSPTRNV